MATHMIPRNTKGEGRILYIFSTKAIIYIAIGLVIGLPFYLIFSTLKIKSVGIGFLVFFALIGFIVATFKIPDIQAFKVTRLVGGENIDDIILRYIKFKKKKNKIYITKDDEEEVENE